jgi:hypothetical protein
MKNHDPPLDDALQIPLIYDFDTFLQLEISSIMLARGGRNSRIALNVIKSYCDLLPRRLQPSKSDVKYSRPIGRIHIDFGDTKRADSRGPATKKILQKGV